MVVGICGGSDPPCVAEEACRLQQLLQDGFLGGAAPGQPEHRPLEPVQGGDLVGEAVGGGGILGGCGHPDLKRLRVFAPEHRQHAGKGRLLKRAESGSTLGR
jgi:hypothetical protein